jgi:hypothetical protein
MDGHLQEPWTQIERFLYFVGRQGGLSFEPQHLGTGIINGTNSLRLFLDSPTTEPLQDSPFCAFPGHPLGYGGIPKALNEWSYGSKETPPGGGLKIW